MKLSERWLREWVNPPVDATSWAAKLNMAGLECEAEPLHEKLPRGVVVARILSAQPHPQADRLRVCEVDAGTGTPLQIVCGAANARAGILVPAALPGAELPGGLRIEQAKLRGVDSSGMLCSASELALADKSEGLLELDASAVPGTPIETHLALADQLLNLELTPNRGDCLSIAGVARETAALYGLQACSPAIEPATVSSEACVALSIEDDKGCPHYVGRVIADIQPDARTPDWMRERLRRSGIRAIHPVVDITNYVMIELGQPMHGFDLARLNGGIRVRRARAGETLKLLNEETVTLSPDDLLIADASGPLVLAGIMGGEGSGVTAATTSIFLESACFDAVSIAHSGRRHKLLSDSRYRNERGVDPALQRRALERATALVLQICGGQPGPVVEAGAAVERGPAIRLRSAQVARLLGHTLDNADIETLLGRLDIALQREADGVWTAHAPSWRPDLRIEADLVEEIGRLYGYERIPPRRYAAALPGFAVTESTLPTAPLAQRLLGRGYQEIITYSFVDPALQAKLDPEARTIRLDNPIAETMAVMRSSLWPGLVATWIHNRQRQQPRARLFETGAVYALNTDGTVHETQRLGGLLAGSAFPEQWGARPVRNFDFFDARGDLEAIDASWHCIAAPHPALHPGQSARLYRGTVPIGWLGALHPRLAASMDLVESVLLFEIDMAALRDRAAPRGEAVPEVPSSRRDLAIVVSEQVPAQALLDVVRACGGPYLASAVIFDVYRGSGVPAGHKSVALGLIFQHASRTLNVAEVDQAVTEIAAGVNTQLGGSLRG